VIVAAAHLTLPFERWLLPAYGVDADEIGSSVLQLPFIRVLFSARPMVHIFFVISGYVLSCRMVKLIRAGNRTKMADSLVSSVFRRAIRLFLPPMAGFMLMEISMAFGWQNWVSSKTLAGKIYNWYMNCSHLVYSWNWDYENYGLLQLWTIPIEFCCSMLLFLVILGTSKLKTWIRLALVGLLIVHCHASGRWGPTEFLAGMVIAEVEEILAERKIGNTRGWKVFWIVNLICGLLLLGWPEDNADKDPILRYFTLFTPQEYINRGGPLQSYFWFSIGALQVIWALFHLPILQKAFTNPVALYFGDISYAVYIVHYYIVTALEGRIVSMAHSWSGGNDTQIRRIMAVFFEILILMPMVVWHADLFWRFVDWPVVKFARWVETICLQGD
jgi:peptidoglycan/LPS O-acetylase OafA/YrhL